MAAAKSIELASELPDSNKPNSLTEDSAEAFLLYRTYG